MSAKNQVAVYTAGYQHKHYQGAQKQFEVLEELEGLGKGFFIKVFFINDKVNANKWQVTWDGIKQDIIDVVGVPIVLQDDLRHPNFAIQNLYAKGYIVDYTLDEKNHEASVIARILDPKTIQLIKDGKLKFVSPAIVARSNLTITETSNGVDLLSRFIALHLALVAQPAYGKEAKIHGTCTGSGQTCSMKLKQLTAEVIGELSHVGDCVSDKISIIKDENPGMSHDQVVAIAISKCKEKGGDDSSSQSMDPLTQTPLLRKLMASINRLESEFNMLQRHASKAEFENHWGYWMKARNIDVFVADGQSVDEAIKSQCLCSDHLNIN